MLGNSAYFFRLPFFFKISFFEKNVSEFLPSTCQTVWILIRPDILSGLIRVQNVCKVYQQTAKVATSRQKVKFVFNIRSVFLLAFHYYM